MRRYALVSFSVISAAILGCGGEDLSSATGDLTVTPTELDFGPVWIGDRVERPVELANDGRADAPLQIAGATAPFDGPTSVTVPAAGDVTVPVGFQPTTPGPVERIFTLTPASGKPIEVSIRGEGVVATLAVAETLDFGAVRVGERLELPLVVENEAPLAIADFRSQLGGQDANAFSIERNVAQIDASGTAEFRIAYAPTRAEPQVATLTVAPCGTCTETRIVLHGRGIDRDLVATPPDLDFGAVPPGASRTLGLGIRNRGEAVAALRQARIVGDNFTVDAAAIPADLAEEGTIELSVTFTPDATGDREGVLQLVDDVGEVALAVPLSGHGGGAILAADPPAVDFGRVAVGWTGTADVLVKNVGEAAGPELLGATIEGSAAWSVIVPVFPAAVEEDGVGLRVQFTGDAPGNETAVLVIATSIQGQPELRVPLAAQVVDDQCQIAEVPEELRFGLVRPGNLYIREVELVNAGTANCIVWDVRLDPMGADTFVLLQLPVDRDLAPGDRMTVQVTFSPLVSSPDVQSTKLLYRTSSLATPEGEVDVSGYAPGIAVVAVPEPVDFGRIPIHRAPRIGLDVENRGYTSIRIMGASIAAGSDPEFGLVSWPQYPVVLDGVTKAHFVLDYLPEVAGFDRGMLEVQVEGAAEPLLVRLRGEGSDDPCGSECDPPVPQCPAPGSGLVNQATTLVGLGVDPNGDPITCEWTVVSAPPGSAARPETPESCTTVFVPDLVGDYNIRLRVRDPLGNVGECVTAYTANAPTTGLWVEMFWDLPNDVDLHLLHPSAGDPNLTASWRTAPYDCYYANMHPEWDAVGIIDNPSLDRDDTVNVGPENIRIDAPTPMQDYHVGIVFYAIKSTAPTSVTTNVYCGGAQVAHTTTTLSTASELVFVGTVNFGPTAPCTWTYRGTHPTP